MKKLLFAALLGANLAAAHAPAAGPNRRAARRYISQVEPANRAMHGVRVPRP